MSEVQTTTNPPLQHLKIEEIIHRHVKRILSCAVFVYMVSAPPRMIRAVVQMRFLYQGILPKQHWLGHSRCDLQESGMHLVQRQVRRVCVCGYGTFIAILPVIKNLWAPMYTRMPTLRFNNAMEQQVHTKASGPAKQRLVPDL